jgi:hypothetical protein
MYDIVPRMKTLAREIRLDIGDIILTGKKRHENYTQDQRQYLWNLIADRDKENLLFSTARDAESISKRNK